MDSQIENIRVGEKYSVYIKKRTDGWGKVGVYDKIEFQITGENNPVLYAGIEYQYEIKITNSYDNADWMLKVYGPGDPRANYRPYLRVNNGKLTINGTAVHNLTKISQGVEGDPKILKGGKRKNKVSKQRLRKSKVRKSKRTKKRTRKRKSKKYSRKTRRSFIKKSRKKKSKLKGGAQETVYPMGVSESPPYGIMLTVRTEGGRVPFYKEVPINTTIGGLREKIKGQSGELQDRNFNLYKTEETWWPALYGWKLERTTPLVDEGETLQDYGILTDSSIEIEIVQPQTSGAGDATPNQA